MTDPNSSTGAGGAETLGFQSEVTQLLELMIHSLYSNREIFLRELISNAADAIDKLRFLTLSDEALYEGDADLRIVVETDRDAGAVTVRDNGVGMTREEVIENLGTIARSGTRAFFENLTGDAQKDARLIGQFGVGFYSAFIVADEVTVRTRRAGEPAAAGVEWRSDGKGEFTVRDVECEPRGTEVTLKLKEDAKEFLEPWRLRSIIGRYSDHIDAPILMPKQVAEEDGEAEAASDAELERVNDGQALWLKAKNELTEDEYQGFYKQLTHDVDDALTWVHSKVEGKLEYTILFYIPKNAPFDLWDRDAGKGVKLYVQRVFILDDDGQLLPRYLRFVRGIVDTNDLPLNVSREILQNNRVVESIRTASVKKVLGVIEALAKNEDDYAAFWPVFGRVLKEGLIEDPGNQQRIAKLLRFHSTHEGAAESPDRAPVSLEAYRERMPEAQKAIYYLLGEDLRTAKQSPLLEIFEKRGFEVLLLTDPVDEWWVTHLTEFDGTPLKSIARGELEFETEGSGAGDEAPSLSEALTARIKGVLEREVEDVRASSRLTDSPACLVTPEFGMTRQLEQMLRAAGQEVPESKPVFEVNASHPVVRQLESETDPARFEDLARLLFDQAVIADGGRVADPGAFSRRMNDLMLRVALAS